MSRSGYSEDLDTWDFIKWRGQVASSIRGYRGQAFIKDLISALEALPEKALILNSLVDSEGAVCAIGAVGKLRGVDMSALDPEEPGEIAAAFNCAHQLASEVAYLNDEAAGWAETPQARYERVLQWARSQLREPLK